MDAQTKQTNESRTSMENTINQTIETTTEVVEVIVTSETFDVSTFDALKSKLEVENADIETTKANKLSTLMQAKMDLFASGLPIQELIAKDAELTTQIIAVQNSGKMDINSVINNNAKFVLYDGVLYRYSQKDVKISKTTGETTHKDTGHEAKFSSDENKNKPLVYVYAKGKTVDVGTYVELTANQTASGKAMNRYLETLVIAQQPTRKVSQSGIPTWSLIQFKQ